MGEAIPHMRTTNNYTEAQRAASSGTAAPCAASRSCWSYLESPFTSAALLLRGSGTSGVSVEGKKLGEDDRVLVSHA